MGFIFNLIITLVLSVVIIDLFSRLYLKSKISLQRPSRMFLDFYPELKEAFWINPNKDDQYFNVLLIGGSVFMDEFSPVGKTLVEAMALKGFKNVRVFNVSSHGNTSLDFLRKYQSLSNCFFDLVLITPGSGEVRVNNVPPEHYRADYSHFGRTRYLDYLYRFHLKRNILFPYTLCSVIFKKWLDLTKDKRVPFRTPRKEWLQYGDEIKSSEAFLKNLESLVKLAIAKDEKMLLTTLAVCASDNYSPEAFSSKELDYVLHLTPFEEFGLPVNVQRTIDAQNQIVRDLVNRYDNLAFVDQAKMMIGHSHYFNDPVHMTVKGTLKYVENLMPEILESIES